MSSNTASGSSGVGGRAFGLAPRGARPAVSGVAGLVLLGVVLVLLLSGGSSPTGHRSVAAYTPHSAAEKPAAHRASTVNPLFKPTSKARYGGLPSFLPKPRRLINRVLTGSATHDAYAVQGETVNVQLPAGHVWATAVGPETPEQGKFPVPATSPAMFVVTFTSASRAIRLDPAAFTLIDEYGHVRHPRVSAMNGGPPPSTIEPHRPVSLKLYDIIPTGNGRLEWAPSGTRPFVAWDFDVEID